MHTPKDKTGSSMPGFLDSELEIKDAQQSRFHVIPVPMEASVSYGSGTALGPSAILEASQQLEAWDGVSFPLELGIHTTAAVDCSGEAAQVIDRIQARTAQSLEMGAIPVALGGEHSLTLGLARALAEKGSFGVVQFDAHADLRHAYEGNPYSHASVMRRIIDDLGVPVFQIGVRAFCHEEHLFRQKAGVNFLDARDLYLNGIPKEILPGDFPEKIYISFDVDGLDPSVIRATGTPVPGGISWHDSLFMIEKMLEKRSLVGFDVVELAPQQGDHASDFAAAQLVYSIMGIAQRCMKNTPPAVRF